MNQEPAAAQPMGELDRLAGTLFDPQPAFADIAARPGRWWVPLALLTAMSIVFIVLFSQRVGWDSTVRKAIQQNPQALERIPADRREELIQQQVRISSTVGYVFSVIGTALFALVLSGIYLFIFNLLVGAEVRFGQAFAIVCYSLLPLGLKSLLAFVLMYVKEPAQFDVENPAATNPAVFFSPDDLPRWLYSLLGSLDIFTIWILLLLATGFAAAGRRLRWGRAFGWVLGPWLLFLVAKSLVLSIIS